MTSCSVIGYNSNGLPRRYGLMVDEYVRIRIFYILGNFNFRMKYIFPMLNL